MSPLGDQREESEAAGEEERKNTREIEDSVSASQAASTPVCHNNKTPLCYDDITSCSAPLLDARRALPRARGDHMRSAASDPLSCESMKRSGGWGEGQRTARAVPTCACRFGGVENDLPGCLLGLMEAIIHPPPRHHQKSRGEPITPVRVALKSRLCNAAIGRADAAWTADTRRET